MIQSKAAPLIPGRHAHAPQAKAKHCEHCEHGTGKHWAELYNALNRARFEGPNGSPIFSSFGRMSGAREPCIGLLALKIVF